MQSPPPRHAETPAPQRLVLFDIDGTLISSSGHGVAAMMEAYTAVWGKSPVGVEYSMSGKTELGISHELMGLLGFSRQEVDQKLPHFWERYPEALRRHLSPGRVTVHAGIRELVQRVGADERMVLALLTGNCEAAARIKVQAADLDGFELGAYGQHHERRDQLPAVAAQLAQERHGIAFEGQAMVIIGDTPNDILCGRAWGAKAIAVATGRFDMQQLAEHEPHHLFEDFSQVDAVLEAILS